MRLSKLVGGIFSTYIDNLGGSPKGWVCGVWTYHNTGSTWTASIDRLQWARIGRQGHGHVFPVLSTPASCASGPPATAIHIMFAYGVSCTKSPYGRPQR